MVLRKTESEDTVNICLPVCLSHTRSDHGYVWAGGM